MNTMHKWLHGSIAVLLALCLLAGLPVAVLATDAASCGQAAAEATVGEAVAYCDQAESVVAVVITTVEENSSIIGIAAGNPENFRSAAIDMFILPELESREEMVRGFGFDPENADDMNLLANEVYDVIIQYYNDNKNSGKSVAVENATKEVMRFALAEIDQYTQQDAVETAELYYNLDRMAAQDGMDAAVAYVLSQQTHHYQNGVCADCGAQDPDHVHAYTAVTVDPTCTEAGYTTYTCICGDTYVSDEIPAKGHVYQSVVTAPTCTENGYTTYTCACADTYIADEVAALGHSFTDYVSDNNAACTEDGTKTAKCDRCDATDTQTEEGTAKGHDYTAVVTAPTCTNKGYTTYTCACGDSYATDQVPALGHSYETEVIPPSCTRRGYTAHICTVCDHSYSDTYVDPTGHTFEEGYCVDCGCEAFVHKPGDINGDGSVNNKDLTRLFQYLSDWDVEVVVEALDINGDGSVNNKDLTRLFQFLSDWDVEIQ